jgi:hypothetical protein
MTQVFPEPIRDLPEADIPLDGLKAYLSQAGSHQILFMQFDQDVEIPEHSHESQWKGRPTLGKNICRIRRHFVFQ